MTLKTFNQVIANGPYAWPGGYPVYFITDDGEALSFEAALEHIETIREAICNRENNGWRVIGAAINWEDPELYCAQTGKRIPSAYAEVDT